MVGLFIKAELVRLQMEKKSWIKFLPWPKIWTPNLSIGSPAC